MMVDPKHRLELLVVYTIGATMTACGFVLTASSAWMMDTGWAVAGVTFCVFLVPLNAAISKYREIKRLQAVHVAPDPKPTDPDSL